ncbi:unnamed protein product [Toxocara canis]|uniref:ZP domain-containing protein n=1 Tax=Toxocara canis TaxID=6265 RepID=A0A183UDX2_TOXCA|nr:unnamed protein product [Toxocara canis]
MVDGTVELNCQRKHFELLYEPYTSLSSDFVRISRGYTQPHSDSRLASDRQICRSEFRRQNVARLVLKASYQRCSGIVSLDVRDGILHTITIDYYTSANHVNRSFTVTCFVPNEGFDLGSVPFRMSLSEGNRNVQNAQEAVFRIGDELNARLEPKAHFSFPVALHGYPVACRTLKTDGKAEAEVVHEGCPSMNGLAGRSLRLVQNISNLGSIQMRFTVSEQLIPWSKPDERSEIGEFLIECQSLPCTGDRLSGINGVPQGLEDIANDRQHTLISLRTTVLLAVLSLLIGISFAAGIWLIHVQTQG